MSNTKHTPGPWKIWGKKFINHKNEKSVTIEIAKVYGEGSVSEANAKLIAAAPELLEALKLSVDVFQIEVQIDDPTILTALAAIKKATE